MSLRLCSILAICFSISGCATTYGTGKIGLTGGAMATTATPRLQKVIFYGNGFTSPDIAQKYALFRAAEYARDQGKPWFLMYATLTDAALDRTTLLPNLGSVDNKPAAFAYVRLLDQEQPNATRTDDILLLINEMRGKSISKSTSDN